MHSGAVEKKTQ